MRPIAELALDEGHGVVVARLSGEIDLSNAEAVRLQIEESVHNRAIGLIIDLTHVGYLDSSGLGLLFDLARRLERRQQRLATVIGVGSPVYEIIDMVGASDRLGVQSSVDKAKLAISGESVVDDQA